MGAEHEYRHVGIALRTLVPGLPVVPLKVVGSLQLVAIGEFPFELPKACERLVNYSLLTIYILQT